VNEKPGTPTNADALLDESVAMLTPLVRLLVASGVTYPQFTAALKTSFLRAAHAELESGSKRVTDSAVSLLSGIHRKDVRALTSDGVLKARGFDRMQSLPDEIFTRWTNDPNYLDVDGLPKVLPMRGRTPDEASFEQLTQSVSRDFHPRSILDELVRLGLADVQADTVRLRAYTYVPQEDFEKTVRYVRANIADHLAAASANLHAVRNGAHGPFLEQSLYADELSEESVKELHRLARRIWESALRRMFALANERARIDEQGAPGSQSMRLRFGTFFYSEASTPLSEPPDLPLEDAKDPNP
jgi:Family of unknown function (DUF6502)